MGLLSHEVHRLPLHLYFIAIMNGMLLGVVLFRMIEKRVDEVDGYLRKALRDWLVTWREK